MGLMRVRSDDGKLRRPLSYANVVSTLALVVALGGGSALAASSLHGKTHKPKPKAKLTLNSADKAFIASHIASGHVAFASTANTATSATTATKATDATNAATAANATSLGGIAASGYTHSDCASQTGQVKGFVLVSASSTFSSTFTPVPGYNCAGQAVQAKRIGTGEYEVQFLGSPVTIAIGNFEVGSNATPGLVGFTSVQQLGPGDFQVYVYNPNATGNHLEDDQFALVAP